MKRLFSVSRLNVSFSNVRLFSTVDSSIISKKPKGRVGKSMEGFSIVKYLSHAGVCSKREAEEMIKEGRVNLNDETVSKSTIRKLETHDLVFVDGSLVKPPPDPFKKGRVFLYHKRQGEIVSSKDEEGSKGDMMKSVLRRIATSLPDLPRLVPVGRLDYNSEGLLVLSDSPTISRLLEIPENAFVRTYRVRAHGLVFESSMDKLRKGITVKGWRYRPMEVKLERPSSNSWFEVTIREGKKREIRNAFAAIGLTVNRIIRTRFGPYELKDLPPGGVKEVKVHTMLKKKDLKK